MDKHHAHNNRIYSKGIRHLVMFCNLLTNRTIDTIRPTVSFNHSKQVSLSGNCFSKVLSVNSAIGLLILRSHFIPPIYVYYHNQYVLSRDSYQRRIDWQKFEFGCKINATKEEIIKWLNVSEDTLERMIKVQYGETFAMVYK